MKIKKLSKKIICLLIAFATIFSFSIFANAYEDESSQKEMNIYALALDKDTKSDSVIIESCGEYIVMDMGLENSLDMVLDNIKNLGIKKISVYFSHLHKDHCGCRENSDLYSVGLRELTDMGVEIENLYLPHPDTAPYSDSYEGKYKSIVGFMDSVYPEGRIIYLQKGSSFSVGDADFSVLAPVTNFTFEETTSYENNCSLITMVKCGDIKYITNGDALSEEILSVCEYYGEALDADIMKMSHHGTGTGNCGEYASLVSPTYAFAQNGTYYNKVEESSSWRFYASWKNAYPYAMCYYTANEEKTLIYHVKDNLITLYKESLEKDNMLKGWVKVVGAKGTDRDFDMYYFDEEGQKVTGIQNFDGKYINLGSGGAMEYGNFLDNVYQGWKTYDEGRRYYEFSDDKTFAFMLKGFNTVDGVLYYFDENGYKAVSKSENKEFITIGGDTYCIGKSGALTVDAYSTVNGKKYYFNKEGKLTKNIFKTLSDKTYYFGEDGAYTSGIYSIDNNDYYFDSSGAMAKSSLITLADKTYCFDENGKKIVGKEYSIGGKIYFFDKNGIMQKNTFVNKNSYKNFYREDGTKAVNCIIRFNGKMYHFDKNGKMACDRQVNIGGKYYYFSKDGSMVRNTRKKIGDDYYYFGKSGVRLNSTLKEINGAKYYFGKSGKMVKSTKVTIGNDNYYFGKSGKMVTSKKIKLSNGKFYYFGKSGKMVRFAKVVINGKSYFFGKKGYLITNSMVLYKGSLYKCSSSGIMTKR